MSTEPSEESQLQESASLDSSAATPNNPALELPPTQLIGANCSDKYDSIKQSVDHLIPPEEQRILDENEDYQAVLKAVNILHYQLKQAKKDVEALIEMKEKAVSEPFEFVNKLKRKAKLDIPPLQKVVCVQEVDWSHFLVPPEGRVARQLANLAGSSARISPHERKALFKNILDMPTPSVRNSPTPNSSHQKITLEIDKAARAMGSTGTTQSRATSVSDLSDKDSDDEPLLKGHKGKGIGKRRASAVGLSTRHLQDPPSPAASTTSNQPTDELTPKSLLARASWLAESSLDHSKGRTGSPESSSRASTTGGDSGDDESKLVTHNLPWSDDEQKRLEELLQIFPDEPVQAQRFNKISAALGTRTPRQVASRVQKYFIKLAKNGLPVPGRITIPPSSLPKTQRSNIKSKSGSDFKKPRPKVKLETDSPIRTSGTSYNVHIPGEVGSVRVSGARYITANPTPSVMMTDHDFDGSSMVGSLAYSNSAQAGFTQPTVNEKGEAIHYGYACDSCGDEPIVGVRYKCMECDVSEEVDLCEKCHNNGTFTNDHHPTSHQFEVITVADPLPYYADDDYAGDSHLGEFDYLG